MLKKLKAKAEALRDRHEERHRPTGFGFALADRIDYLDGAQWDVVVAAGSRLLSRPYLRVLENHGPGNVVPRYALIFRGAQPVAVVVVQVVTVSGDRLYKKTAPSRSPRTLAVLKRLAQPMVQAAVDQLEEKMLVVGNLMSWGCHGVCFVVGENPGELWPAVTEAVYRIRRGERLHGQADLAMIKDLPVGQDGVESLRRYSYRAMETEPDMVLAIDPAWRTFDDYLGALGAKSRRKVKDLDKKLAAAGCTLEVLTGGLESAAVRLHELYLAVQGNAAVRLVTLPPGYLPALAAALGTNFRCTMIRRAGEILGFVTSVCDGETAIGYYIGFDRTAAGEGLPLYLRLLHVPIADAIDWRCARLSLGRTALEPKAGLGAKPEPQNVWIRHRVPAMNWLIRGLLGAVPHAEAPERNPFKSQD